MDTALFRMRRRGRLGGDSGGLGLMPRALLNERYVLYCACCLSGDTEVATTAFAVALER